MTSAIELKNVAVAYHTPAGIQRVLNDISLHIQTGVWTAVIGRNGSGKSTLGRVLAGLCGVSKGEVTYPGGKRVQMIFQNPDAQIVGQTIYEDLCFGLENLGVSPAVMETRAMRALAEVGLNLPPSTETGKLSGGQKQLLSIAGAICLHPSIVVFDEPTAMLDPRARSRVLHVARELCRRGTTVIWMTQWMNELAGADRVIVLNRGNVAFDGTPQTFFYGTKPSDTTAPCDDLGFPPPYPVQVARALQLMGKTLHGCPLTTAELAAVVNH